MDTHRTKPSAPFDDPKDRCFCGISVKLAARVIAILGALTSVLSAIAVVVSNGISTRSVLLVLLQCIYVAIDMLIVVAQKINRPRLYLPYLIVQAFWVCLHGLFTVAISIFGVYLLFNGSAEWGSVLMIVSTICALFFPVCVWVYWLVWRSYKEEKKNEAKEEQHEGKEKLLKEYGK